MLINQKNVEIISHCAAEPRNEYLLNGLQLTGNGTVATNGYYSVAISALEKDGTRNCSVISKKDAESIMLRSRFPQIEVDLLPSLVSIAGTDIVPLEGKLPWLEDFAEKEPVTQEIVVTAGLLRDLLQAAATFAGDDIPIRIRFASDPYTPIRFDTRNRQTGQTFYGLLMGHKPGCFEAMTTPQTAAAEIPAPPAIPDPPAAEDEFEKAIRLAAAL